MTSLASLQDRFQRAVLAGDESVLPDLLDSPREKSDVLFAVYRHAYGARLAEIVQSDFERLRVYLGDEAFDAAARAYIAAHPSHQPNARWFSQAMPEFLRTTPPWSDRPELADLAQIERSLGNAFDAPDGAVLSLDRLAAIAASDWAKLRLAPHPSASRVDLSTNAAAIWIALKEEREPPGVESFDEAEKLLFWRHDLMPQFRVLPQDEAMMWDEAVAGVPFGVLCEMLAFRSDPDAAPLRAASLLQGWIVSGLLSDAR